MNYRTRRIEQRRQQRLGCFILGTAVLTAIVAASVILAFLPRIPLVGTVAFYVLAVLIAGAIDRSLRRMLGFQSRKASLRHLGSAAPEAPMFSFTPNPGTAPDEAAPLVAQVTDSPQTSGPADDGSAESDVRPQAPPLVVRNCPNCGIRVAPKADGTCPACGQSFPD